MSDVYIVVGTLDGHMEVLDSLPKWDWTSLSQRVYLAGVNGGDAVEVKQPPCEALENRKAFVRALQDAVSPDSEWGMDDGSEEALKATMSVINGMAREYEDDGDQMAEHCTCGRHAND